MINLPKINNSRQVLACREFFCYSTSTSLGGLSGAFSCSDVGVCAVVPSLSEVYGYPDKLIKCTPKLNNIIHSKYLSYYMSQGEARNYIRSKIKTTSGQNGIAGADIKKAVVFLPDLYIQEKIVSKIESRLSVCDSIAQSVNTTLSQAATLRQSILKQAFKGSLT